MKESSSSPSCQYYDVFNGDADGICALHQLRLAKPRDAVLVTGVKRDVELLKRVPIDRIADHVEVTVLDISLDANFDALKRILDAGGHVCYVDHHAALQAFEHPRLQLHWHDAPEVCTSLLVDRHLQGRYRQWAATAAFGDNLLKVGRALTREMGLSDGESYALEELGFLLNYNAYGDSIGDLHFAPETLYRALHEFIEPLDFITASSQYRLLRDGYKADGAQMAGLKPYWQSPTCGAIYLLPNAAWSRRISGVFANKLAAVDEERAYAVLTEKADGSYLVSVRSGAPIVRSANGFCGQFASGGGRRLAAGINSLPANDLERFVSRFSDYFAARNRARAGDDNHEH